MTEFDDHIGKTSRVVGRGTIPAGDGHRIALQRLLDAPTEEVWDACTNAARLKRWFLPVTGDLRPGGDYQFEGNAGGQILACDPPRHLKVSWVFGEDSGPEPASEVELHLTPNQDGGATLELVHTAIVEPEFWEQYGPGAVAIGWDLALVALALHLAGVDVMDDAEWESSAVARDFIAKSGHAWGIAFADSGATPEDVEGTTKRSIEAYAPPV